MKKKLLLESAAITVALAALMFSAVSPAFASFPGQNYEYDYSPSGPYGEYTYSLIGADYGGSKYDYGYFHSQIQRISAIQRLLMVLVDYRR